jgi:cellulose synthase/poly-beta-1,6-N-acetylglucosamine synthase-like glycosyltransferase
VTVQTNQCDICFTLESKDEREEDQHIATVLWNRIHIFRYMYTLYMFLFMYLYSIGSISFASSIMNLYRKCAAFFFVHLFYQCLCVYMCIYYTEWIRSVFIGHDSS